MPKGEQKSSRYSGSVYVVKRKTQNSTIYYYNPSGAREQEEFLLEYKFLHLFVFAGEIVENLTMRRSFLLAARQGKTAAKRKN